MKLNKDARVLLDRYLLAVKRELTGKEREDIIAEIESYVFDHLEESLPKTKEVNESQMESVLKEMGAPRKVAAQYSLQCYLIGPRLFPVYFLVLKIVVAVVIGALTLSTIITAVTGETVIGWLAILEYLGAIWSGMLSTAGSITLVFAIIERAAQGKPIKEIEELQELKLSDLPELPEEEKEVSRVGTTIEITLGVIGLAFFTYIQTTGGLVPYFINPGTEMQSVRLFTDNFVQFIPVILALGGLEVARNITLLAQGHHSSLTNWWHILAESASVVMMGFLISSLPLITFEAFQDIFGIDSLVKIESLANMGLAIAMGLGIFGNIVDVIRKTVREMRNPAL